MESRLEQIQRADCRRQHGEQIAGGRMESRLASAPAGYETAGYGTTGYEAAGYETAGYETAPPGPGGAVSCE